MNITTAHEGRAKFVWLHGDLQQELPEGMPKRILRVIVTGSPLFSDRRMLEKDGAEIIKPLSERYRIEIVTTGGSGCDEMIRDWAIEQGYLVSGMKPDWDSHSKKAPDVRNQAMIDYVLETGLQSVGIVYIVQESRAARHVFDAIKKSQMLAVHRTIDWTSRVLCYPSNLAGECTAGLAKAALSWGAQEGFISGRSGQAYAICMRDDEGELLPFSFFESEIGKFIRQALDNPNDRFLYNRIGCRDGEYDQEHVSALFSGAPPNIVIIDAQGAEICLAAQWETALSVLS